ncbi:MAG: Tetratricopeptide repeat protein [Gemmataceae bacterium]|nr:Tetratricopeptide repeat protein [Gemmataceae bacterium]
MGRAGIGFLFRVGAFAVGVAVLAGGLTGRADDAKPGTKKAADAGDEALKEDLLKLNRASDEDAQRAKLVAFVKDKERAKKGIALAVKLQKEAKGKDKPFNFTASMILGRAARFVKDYKAAEYFYEHGAEAATKLESGEKMIQAYEGLIDTYWDQKRFDDVIDVCEKFVELKGPDEVDKAKPFVLERLVQAKARQGKTDEAVRITEGLIQLTEGNWYFVQLKGWVYREAEKYEEAIEAYTDALDKIDAAKGLKGDLRDKMKDQVRYILSGLHVDNKDIDKAATQLQTLIKRDPENPTYKNDLGFIWADHDLKLDESEKLIREALDLDKKRQEKAKADGKLDEVKENAAYLDSLGWVLFKQKKYKDALPYLKKAAADEDEGAHLEIWDHVGDVYMALGQKTEATDAWQKGLTMENVSKRDVDRRKKVVAKLKAAGVEPKVKEPEPKDPPKKKTDPKKKID